MNWNKMTDEEKWDNARRDVPPIEPQQPEIDAFSRIPKKVVSELLSWMVFDFVLKYTIWAGIIYIAAFVFPDYTKQLLSWIHPGLVNTSEPMFMIFCWVIFLTLADLIKNLMQPLLMLLSGEELNRDLVRCYFIESPIVGVIFNPIYYSIAGLYIWWVVVSPVIAILVPIGVVCLIWWKWHADIIAAYAEFMKNLD